MKPPRHAALLAFTALSLSAVPLAFAHDGHAHHHPAPATEAATVLASGQGIVKKIDADKNRLTITHDPIPKLGWPAMTMPLSVTDPALLKGLQVGDKISFDLKDEQTIGGIRRE